MSEGSGVHLRYQYKLFLDSLPTNWETKPISQLGAVVGGGTPSRDAPSFWRGTIPWVTPGEVSGEASKYLHDTADHISAAGLAGSGANLLPSGSLMVTTRATLGARVINAVPMATNQGFKSVVFRQVQDADYYFHLFEKVKPELIRRGSGTTFLEVSGAEFGAILVPSPSCGEKQQIAYILDTLDIAIQQTVGIIAKLKAVKQGLLHDLLTRGIDANGELRPPHSQAPRLYDASALGWTPKSWTPDILARWLLEKPSNGYSPPEAPRWTGVQMLGLGCLTPEGFSPLQLKPAPANDKRLVSAMLTPDDLLMSRSNTRALVGMVGIFEDVGTPCTYPDLMMRLRPASGTDAEFLQYVLQSAAARRQIEAHASGTSGSMVKISGRTVSNLVLVMPPQPEQEAICARAAASATRIAAESEKIALLRSVKAGLMDDLLTGRVRVSSLLTTTEQPALQAVV